MRSALFISSFCNRLSFNMDVAFSAVTSILLQDHNFSFPHSFCSEKAVAIADSVMELLPIASVSLSESETSSLMSGLFHFDMFYKLEIK